MDRTTGGDDAADGNMCRGPGLDFPQRTTQREPIFENRHIRAGKWCGSWAGAEQSDRTSSSSVKPGRSQSPASAFGEGIVSLEMSTLLKRNDLSRGSLDRRTDRRLRGQTKVDILRSRFHGTSLPSTIIFLTYGPIAHSEWRVPESWRVRMKSAIPSGQRCLWGSMVMEWNRCRRAGGSHREQTREHDTRAGLSSKTWSTTMKSRSGDRGQLGWSSESIFGHTFIGVLGHWGPRWESGISI